MAIFRRTAVTLLALILAGLSGTAQSLRVLHIRVVVVDASGTTRPVPRHALLVSDDPNTMAPRRVVTAVDGTAELRLKPGNYTVESDQPFRFEGKAYEWRQDVVLKPDADISIELTSKNASTEALTGTAASGEGDLSALSMQWMDSVVTIWSDVAHGSGFVIDSSGLIATNQRTVGSAATVQVEFPPATRVEARVVARSKEKNVAIVWVNPSLVAKVTPVRLGYGKAKTDSEVFTIGSPLFQQKEMTTGKVRKIGAHAIESDAEVAEASAGGPLFTSEGEVVGISTFDADGRDASFVPIEDAKDAIAEAAKAIKSGTPPSAKPLPSDPAEPVSPDALKAVVEKRAGSLSPYTQPGTDFDVNFVTPVNIYGAQYLQQKGSRAPHIGDASNVFQPADDFANWTTYADQFLPVVMVRVTPKLVESFWAAVGRNAAQTQGVSIPALKHLKANFARLQLFCGDAEVTPIHPFRIEHHVPDRDDDAKEQVIYEGLYVYSPEAIGPQCGTVKLTLFTDKDGDKPMTQVVDSKVLDLVRQDFQSLRR